jgi:hypothetical protein
MDLLLADSQSPTNQQQTHALNPKFKTTVGTNGGAPFSLKYWDKILCREF